MDMSLQVKMNPGLYIKNPEQSELGRKIVTHSIDMIYEMGFEDFTFRKLAQGINTTEASIYRYFENKHKLLTYITTWFWTWMEYQLVFYTNNISSAEKKIETIIALLTFQLEDKFLQEHIDKDKLQQIIIAEANKSYLTKHVEEDNKAQLFKPYKDLCARISDIFTEYNNSFEYPHSLASTLIETAHHQMFFKDHLPSLTDLHKDKGVKELTDFLTLLVFKTLEP